MRVPELRGGQKLCAHPRVQEPVAATSRSDLTPRGRCYRLNSPVEPEPARRFQHPRRWTEMPSDRRREPGGPRRMLKTQASYRMEPGKERKKTRALHPARPIAPFWRCPCLEPQTPQEDPHSACADFSQGRPCTGMSLGSLRCSHFLLFFLSWITYNYIMRSIIA